MTTSNPPPSAWPPCGVPPLPLSPLFSPPLSPLPSPLRRSPTASSDVTPACSGQRAQSTKVGPSRSSLTWPRRTRWSHPRPSSSPASSTLTCTSRRGRCRIPQPQTQSPMIPTYPAVAAHARALSPPPTKTRLDPYSSTLTHQSHLSTPPEPSTVSPPPSTAVHRPNKPPKLRYASTFSRPRGPQRGRCKACAGLYRLTPAVFAPSCLPSHVSIART